MASYFIDTEFLEGTQKRRILGIELPKYFDTKSTIDLISIGLVSEDGREYYAISKDFNLEEAWNKLATTTHVDEEPYYWIRENVLKPIFIELVDRWALLEIQAHKFNFTTGYNPPIKFTYKNLKKLINKYGKTNTQIAEEIKEFVYNPTSVKPLGTEESIEFYGYYADYDWVVFCWLFGSMINLPNKWPMYCKDLKQTLDELQISSIPESVSEHNALVDAIWNEKLHNHINLIKGN